MFKYIQGIIVGCFCLMMAGAVSAQPEKEQVSTAEMQVAETFVMHLVKEDYKAAYVLFSPQVMEQYPYGLFAEVQKSFLKRLGRMQSFVPGDVSQEQNKASKQLMFDVTFTQNGKTSVVPLVVICDGNAESPKLLSCKLLKDKQAQADSVPKEP
ncbi:MAG: hypothetical protein GY868_08220 [Deltaproteobacteria bacterium]|nr:hypothetical protein [Deltaproteobacteria bacterium]